MSTTKTEEEKILERRKRFGIPDPTEESQKRIERIKRFGLQTKDNITYETTKKLIEYGLNIDNILKMSEKELVNIIFKVSFHNVKAKNIKKLAEKLREEYNDDAPETLEEIIKFPGIGRKIGLLYLKECCQQVEGVAVDTHIHKIANRLKWVNNTKDPNKTSIELEKIVDKKYWESINGILVGFGQEICKSVKPLCDKCTLCDDCSYYKEKSKKNKKTKKEKSSEKEERKSEKNEKKEKSVKKEKKKDKKQKKKIRKKKINYEIDDDTD